MELRHFRYFVAVAEEENVSRAALKLHVSQPGLSRQIRDLEGEIGFQLFQRGAKSLHLTQAGKVFLVEARAVLRQADEAVEKARLAVGAARGTIHVGYAPSLTVQILPVALRIFQAKYPGVRVALHDLSTEEMVSRLCKQELDLALMVQPGRKMLQGLGSKELARYPIRLAVAPGHRLAKSRSVTLAQVVSEPLIAYSHVDYPEYHRMLGRLFASTGRKPRIVEEHDGVNGIVAAVESGGGVALVPSCVACMLGKRLNLIPLAAVVPDIVVIAAWRGETAHEAARQFIDAASG